jgi:hypothetical protein
MSLDYKPNAAGPTAVEAAKKETKRIPMSVPVAKLSVPDIPGYHQHWFLGESRVMRAIKAGYEFVDQDETVTSDWGVAGGQGQDMGSRVTYQGGDVDEQGKSQRLYLMKIRDELWQEDQKALEGQSEKMLEALRVGQGGNQMPGGDHSHRYVGEQNKNVFKPTKALQPRSS